MVRKVLVRIVLVEEEGLGLKAPKKLFAKDEGLELNKLKLFN